VGGAYVYTQQAQQQIEVEKKRHTKQKVHRTDVAKIMVMVFPLPWLIRQLRGTIMGMVFPLP
jgi:hypothetical protein